MARPRFPAPSMAVDQAFGRVIKDLRTKARLSQEAVGLESGSGRTFVSQLERGERGASLKTLFRLAAVLGVPASKVIRLVEEQLSQ
jgi:transcriptional regulator with XRE-family HTH domain